MDLAERLLPGPHFEERHSICGIRASTECVLEAIARFDDRADRWIDLAIRLRAAEEDCRRS